MGTLTITTTAPIDTRILAALGKRLGLPGPASVAQYKQWTIDQIKQMVFDQEKSDARVAAESSVTEIAPT